MILPLLFSLALACGQSSQGPLPACEWCGTEEAPHDLSWHTQIAPDDEPGEPLVVEGRVFQYDGITPAPDVIIYLYHTNAEGIYPKRGDETGNGRRHGYIRSWLKTDQQGRYRFHTIRPGTYPSRSEPAHIHITLQPPGKEEFWIPAYHFAGDPLLNRSDIHSVTGVDNSSNILEVKRDESGIWRGVRNIVLRSG